MWLGFIGSKNLFMNKLVVGFWINESYKNNSDRMFFIVVRIIVVYILVSLRLKVIVWCIVFLFFLRNEVYLLY